MTVLRTTMLLLLCTTTTAFADVRRSEVPAVLRGAWIPAAESCPGSAATRVELGAETYQGPDGTCRVDWTEERAGTPGTIYSVHLRCPTATGESQRNMIVWLKGEGDAVSGPSFDKLTRIQPCR